MFAITINLIHNSERYKKVAKYTYFAKIVSYVVLFVLIVINFALFIGKTTLLKRVEELNKQYQTFLTANNKLTTSTAKVAYSYTKLQKIKEVVASSPQYYQQYEYLLSTVLADADVQIEDLSFDGKSGSTLRISSTSVDEILIVLGRIENEIGKKTFSKVSLSSFQMSDKKENKSKIYTASFVFQFTNIFNENTN
ncbi:hypothetical protein COU88_05405 [Candidatus Roizmanbacteria bacterium CG10_big_fil_rev_8_21_14_0_10_39_6]|uniref:PilN domain-containing protein n=1 Tax=Candidatus Roizmanbacteria bacterium CG10_big_fil_rev_8_21_14_0_10_39_6 TaxID=1974853 RepID=A0A2M8KR10_9BACT|nr:MAG: hypothetical protein COU88_05405 [Candidatus Roizmanbacteria bacterium CG10_big_fil_rev_8_21_14_0_10_39_6]